MYQNPTLISITGNANTDPATDVLDWCVPKGEATEIKVSINQVDSTNAAYLEDLVLLKDGTVVAIETRGSFNVIPNGNPRWDTVATLNYYHFDDIGDAEFKLQIKARGSNGKIDIPRRSLSVMTKSYSEPYDCLSQQTKTENFPTTPTLDCTDLEASSDSFCFEQCSFWYTEIRGESVVNLATGEDTWAARTDCC